MACLLFAAASGNKGLFEEFWGRMTRKKEKTIYSNSRHKIWYSVWRTWRRWIETQCYVGVSNTFLVVWFLRSTLDASTRLVYPVCYSEILVCSCSPCHHCYYRYEGKQSFESSSVAERNTINFGCWIRDSNSFKRQVYSLQLHSIEGGNRDKWKVCGTAFSDNDYQQLGYGGEW